MDGESARSFESIWRRRSSEAVPAHPSNRDSARHRFLSARFRSGSAPIAPQIGTPVVTPAEPRAGDSAAILLEAIELLEGGASPADLSRATGLSPRTVSKHLARLREAGCVDGSQRLPTLTAAGRARLTAPAPAAQGSWAEAIQDVWPPAYAALIRLLLDAIVARAAAPGRRGQPGFIVFGPVHTFKTSIADFVGAALGEREGSAVAQLHLLAPGEIIGRRVRAAGEQWTFRPSPWTLRPFVCFDELGLAQDETRRHVGSYLHGESAVIIEGEEVPLAPTAMVCFNPRDGADALWPLPEATWRRCIRLATAPLRPSLPADMARRLQEWHRGAKPAPLDLSTLTLPRTELPATCWELFDGAEGFHARCLTDRGRDWHDRRAFELCVLGRAARMGAGHDARLEALALGVGVDLLTVADTVPGLVASSGWALDVGQLRSLEMLGAQDVASAIERVTAQRAEARQRSASQQRSDAMASLELVGEREALQVRLSEGIQTIRQVPPGRREEAGALKKQLAALRERAAHCGSPASLGAIEDLAAPYLERAAALRGEIDREQRARAQALESARAELRSLGRLSGRTKVEADAIRQAIGDASRVADQPGFSRALNEARQATHALASSIDQDRLQGEHAAEVTRARRTRDTARATRVSELRKLGQRRRLKPGEDVAGVLVAAGVLIPCEQQRRTEVPPTIADRVVARLMREPAGPTEHVEVVKYFVDCAGTSWWPQDVSEWGTPALQQVIAAAMERA
jgi:DNA-binding transcriptional ArsR family regulator